jgi:hypothetical protein
MTEAQSTRMENPPAAMPSRDIACMECFHGMYVEASEEAFQSKSCNFSSRMTKADGAWGW